MTCRSRSIAAFVLVAFCHSVSAQVFINEIHYDNTGGDTGEAIEVAGPVGTDLAGCQLVLYNGSNGAPYNTFNLSGVIAGPPDGFGALSFAIASIQNGSPDGVALVDATGTVLEFLSYEGEITATGGPANGTTSTDILATEPSTTAVGDSLQLTESGPTTAGTPWAGPLPNSFGALNAGQDFSSAGTPVDCGDAPGGEVGSGEIVINEIDYDQPSTDTSEFVELKNVSGGDINLSGYVVQFVNGANDERYETFNLPDETLVDGAYFVICANADNTPNCNWDVSPNSNLIQNGPDGILLLNGADLVDGVAYEGNVDGVTEGNAAPGDFSAPFISISRFPDGTDTNDNSSDFSVRCTSPGVANLADDFDCSDPNPPELVTAAIYEIQGAGSASPFDGDIVTTEGNVVTAVGPNGFAMQTPDKDADADPETSNGIYVFTGSAPTVAVGDIVDVTGEVDEFFGLTEFTNGPTVTIISSGLPVGDMVTAVAFDAGTPSPDPSAPSCAIELECFEGMLVEIADGAVTASNQRFNPDPTAEVFITAAPERTFREPGIEFPGMAGLPVWDGNPEVFEMDPDKLGLGNDPIPAGSSFSATGVIGFEFGDYELWPSSLTVHAAELPRPVRHKRWFETTVGSLNLFRLFDDVDDPPGSDVFGEPTDDDGQVASAAEYQRRLDKFVQYIIYDMRTPDILGVQEVESLKVLEDLAAAVNAAHPWARYEAFLVEGNDRGTIDVGFLVRKWRVWFPRVEQLGAMESYEQPNGEFDILHDRPPLLLKAWVGFIPIRVMVVHNRSLSGIDGSDGERVRLKRFLQAQSVAEKVQDIQTRRFGRNLVVIGDFNAFQFSDGYVDALGHIRGDFDPAEALLSGDDLVEPDLMNQLMSLPEDERYSFIFRGNAQTLDHALTSQALDYRVRGLEYARGNADAAVDLINDESTSLRASDHDGLVLYIYKGWLRKFRRH